MKKKLYRSRKDKLLAGVCGGVAEYFKIDPTIVRVIVALIALSSLQLFAVSYIVAAVVMPEKPKGYIEDEDEVEVLDKDGHKIEKSRDTRQILGILFVGAGILMLLSKTISWFDSSMLLAISIIGIGIYVLFRKDESEES